MDLKQTLLALLTVLVGGSLAWAECPPNKESLTLITPSGISKTLCVPDQALRGLENAAENSPLVITTPPPRCGGIAGFACPDGLTCLDDPRDGCSRETGGADCDGLCYDIGELEFCGGFAAVPCPPNQVCVDDPRDTCVEGAGGGADCNGFCVSPPEL